MFEPSPVSQVLIQKLLVLQNSRKIYKKGSSSWILHAGQQVSAIECKV